MAKRFFTIWFHYLKTDWFTIKKPELKQIPFVLAAPDHGRMVVTEANILAEKLGIYPNMVLADARIVIPSLKVIDYKATLSNKLLSGIADWCIRFTPTIALDLPDGLILDITGCAHLWGNEKKYHQDIVNRLNNLGYHVRAGIADTIGAAWAITRYGNNVSIIENGQQVTDLLSLPPEALRIDFTITEALHKLGLKQINSFISMPRSALRRRFGQQLLTRLNQALGSEEEIIQPIIPVEPYQERLNCLEPIITATGIEIALKRLLETICNRLKAEGKGLRKAIFKCYRIDNRSVMIEIGTNRSSNNASHLFKLFEIKLSAIEPALGIELFVIEAKKIEKIWPQQENLWKNSSGLENTAISELLDRLEGKLGKEHIHRYLPDDHYWPERSFKNSLSTDEKPTTSWRINSPRPIQILPSPEPIIVTAPIPDYPPMLFRYKGKLHKIVKADGPERIEQEWWLQRGEHRDYYYVEDEGGNRYWIFRLGHYTDKAYQWFIHGFFA